MTYVTLIYRTLYGFYGWLAFIVGFLLALIATILVPAAALRHRLAACRDQSHIHMLGRRSRQDKRHWKTCRNGHAIVVANHASYVDGILAQGLSALPVFVR